MGLDHVAAKTPVTTSYTVDAVAAPAHRGIRIENDFFKALAFVLNQVRCACGKKSAESVVAGVCQRRSI
jgi:hypothetical protein